MGILSNNIIITNDLHIFLNNNNHYSADIFVSEDINGSIGLNGCDHRGSASRRAFIIKKSNNYLYFDGGNISSIDINRNELLINSFEKLNISGINLTLRDYYNAANIISDKNKYFFSANSTYIRVQKYIRMATSLKNKDNDEIPITIFVTGVTRQKQENESDSIIRNRKSNITNSINSLYNDSLKSDIKILFFDEQPFILSEILLKSKIKFDFVVCQYSTFSEPNHTSKIYGIPIIYPDYYGRSIANVKIHQVSNKNIIEIKYLIIPQNLHEDEETALAVRQVLTGIK